MYWEPEHPLTEYAATLHSYVETFKPSADELSWADYGIYSIFCTAKNEYERSKLDEQQEDFR